MVGMSEPILVPYWSFRVSNSPIDLREFIWRVNDPNGDGGCTRSSASSFSRASFARSYNSTLVPVVGRLRFRKTPFKPYPWATEGCRWNYTETVWDLMDFFRDMLPRDSPCFLNKTGIVLGNFVSFWGIKQGRRMRKLNLGSFKDGQGFGNLTEMLFFFPDSGKFTSFACFKTSKFRFYLRNTVQHLIDLLNR